MALGNRLGGSYTGPENPYIELDRYPNEGYYPYNPGMPNADVAPPIGMGRPGMQSNPGIPTIPPPPPMQRQGVDINSSIASTYQRRVDQALARHRQWMAATSGRAYGQFPGGPSDPAANATRNIGLSGEKFYGPGISAATGGMTPQQKWDWLRNMQSRGQLGPEGEKMFNSLGHQFIMDDSFKDPRHPGAGWHSQGGYEVPILGPGGEYAGSRMNPMLPGAAGLKPVEQPVEAPYRQRLRMAGNLDNASQEDVDAAFMAQTGMNQADRQASLESKFANVSPNHLKEVLDAYGYGSPDGDVAVPQNRASGSQMVNLVHWKNVGNNYDPNDTSSPNHPVNIPGTYEYHQARVAAMKQRMADARKDRMEGDVYKNAAGEQDARRIRMGKMSPSEAALNMMDRNDVPAGDPARTAASLLPFLGHTGTAAYMAADARGADGERYGYRGEEAKNQRMLMAMAAREKVRSGEMPEAEFNRWFPEFAMSGPGGTGGPAPGIARGIDGKPNVRAADESVTRIGSTGNIDAEIPSWSSGIDPKSVDVSGSAYPYSGDRYGSFDWTVPEATELKALKDMEERITPLIGAATPQQANNYRKALDRIETRRKELQKQKEERLDKVYKNKPNSSNSDTGPMQGISTN